MITRKCWQPQQVRLPFWFCEGRNHSKRMLSTVFVCSLVKHGFCWQFHEGSFLQCSQRHCTFIIPCLHGIDSFFCQLNFSAGDEKWPLPLILSYMRQVLRMENIRSYLSFKNRIRIFIEAIQITVFTWLVLDIFLIYQCIFISQALG